MHYECQSAKRNDKYNTKNENIATLQLRSIYMAYLKLGFVLSHYIFDRVTRFYLDCK